MYLDPYTTCEAPFIFHMQLSFVLLYKDMIEEKQHDVQWWKESFQTPIKFYTISNIIMKYLLKIFFCVSKGVAALDRQKQIQMIFFLFIYKKN